MIVFHCEHCGKQYSFSDRFAGRKMLCAQCKSDLVVPESEEELGLAPMPPDEKPAWRGEPGQHAGHSNEYRLVDEPERPVVAPPPIPGPPIPPAAPIAIPTIPVTAPPLPPAAPPSNAPPTPDWPTVANGESGAASLQTDTDSAILAYVFEEKAQEKNRLPEPARATPSTPRPETDSPHKKNLIYGATVGLMLLIVVGIGLGLIFFVDWREADSRPAVLGRIVSRKNETIIEAKKKETESNSLRLRALHDWNRTGESIDSLIMTLGEYDDRRLDLRDMEQMLRLNKDDDQRRQLLPKRDETAASLQNVEERLQTLRNQVDSGIKTAAGAEDDADGAEENAARSREEARFYENREAELRRRIEQFPNERDTVALPSFEPERRRAAKDAAIGFDADWTENHFRRFGFSGPSLDRFAAAFDGVRRLYGNKSLRATWFEKTPLTVVFPVERNARADLGSARFLAWALRFPDYRDPIRIGSDPDTGKIGEIRLRFGNPAGHVEYRTFSPRYCEALFYEGQGKFVIVEFSLEGDSYWRRTDRFDMDRFQIEDDAGPVFSGSDSGRPAEDPTPPSFFSRIDWVEIHCTPLTDRTTLWMDGMKTASEKSQPTFELLQVETLQQAQRNREKEFFRQRRRAAPGRLSSAPVSMPSPSGREIEFIDPEAEDATERSGVDLSRPGAVPKSAATPDFAETDEERTRQLVRWILQEAGGRTRLRIGGRSVSLDANSSIPDSFFGAAFEEIDLAGCRKLDESRLDGIGERKELKRLNLAKTGLQNPDLVKLAALESLESLNLSDNKLSFEGLPALRALKNLKELNLDGVNASPGGLEALGSLGALRSLSLSRSAVGSTDLNYLLPLGKLESLDLSETKIGDRALALLRPFSTLRSLDLSRTRISDAGLANLEPLRHLRELRLDGTALTDACLPHLAKLPNLETVSVTKTKITRNGVRDELGADRLGKFNLTD